MAFMKATLPEFWANADFECSHRCGWKGKGTEAICEIDDLVRCPKCRESAVRDTFVTWAMPSWVSDGG